MFHIFIPVFFAGSLFFAAEIFRLGEVFRYYMTPWTDLVLTHSFFSLVVAVVATGMACLLLVLEWATRPLQKYRFLSWLQLIPEAVSFMVIVTVFLHVLRLLAAAFIPSAKGISPDTWIICAAIGALSLFAVRANYFRAWLKDVMGPLAVLSLAVLVFSGGYFGWSAGRSYLERASGEQRTASGQQPNVILIMVDSLTARDMSLYGYSLPTTPNLERLAKEWTVYDNFHSNATSTVASRAAILTGRYPFTNELNLYGDLARKGNGWTVLPKVLRQSGYRTVEADWVYHPNMHHVESYYDEIRMIGDSQRPVVAFLGRLAAHVPARVHMLLTYTLQEYTGNLSVPPRDSEWDEARKLLAEQDTRPFFLHLNSDRPHYPYVPDNMGLFLPKSSGFTTVASQKPILDQLYKATDQSLIDQLRLRYDENIRDADTLIGEFIDELKASGKYDDSLIILTTDHGENFVKGNQGHRTYLMSAMEHTIPLLVKYPKQHEAKRVSSLAQSIDILPTVMDVVGVPSAGLVDGVSLLGLKDDPTRLGYVTRFDQWQPTGKTGTIALDGHMKFADSLGSTFLYDLKNDPYETQNLISDDVSESAGMQEALNLFEQHQKHLRAGGSIQDAPPVPHHMTPAMGSAQLLSSSAGDKLKWENADQHVQAWASGRLHFAAEAQRSYTIIPTAPGATHAVVRFTTNPGASITVYLEAQDSTGKRLDFRAVVADSRLSPDGKWSVLVPIPEQTANLVVSLKNAYVRDPGEAWDISVEQYSTLVPQVISSVLGQQLQWKNLGTNENAWTGDRLHFGGESNRASAEFELKLSTTHLQIRFKADPKADLVNYVAAYDNKGNRLDFKITLSPPTSSTEDRKVLVPLPTGTVKASVAFKSAEENQSGDVWSLGIDQVHLQESVQLE